MNNEIINKINELNQSGNAQKLWEVLKDRHLSKEELEALNPLLDTTANGLISVIKDLEITQRENVQALREMQSQLIGLLESLMHDKEMSWEERKYHCDRIYLLLDKLAQALIDNAKGNKDLKKYAITVLGMLALVVIIVVSGPSKKSGTA